MPELMNIPDLNEYFRDINSHRNLLKEVSPATYRYLASISDITQGGEFNKPMVYTKEIDAQVWPDILRQIEAWRSISYFWVVGRNDKRISPALSPLFFRWYFGGKALTADDTAILWMLCPGLKIHAGIKHGDEEAFLKTKKEFGEALWLRARAWQCHTGFLRECHFMHLLIESSLPEGVRIYKVIYDDINNNIDICI